MSTDQFDAGQVVRIRMSVEYVNLLGEHTEAVVWSDRMPRRIAEADVAGGSYHLSLEHGGGSRVLSAAIVPWRFN